MADEKKSFLDRMRQTSAVARATLDQQRERYVKRAMSKIHAAAQSGLCIAALDLPIMEASERRAIVQLLKNHPDLQGFVIRLNGVMQIEFCWGKTSRSEP